MPAKLLDGTAVAGGVYHADALDLIDAIPSSSVHMILTDPPYGVEYQSNMPVEGWEKPKIANDEWRNTEKLLRAFIRASARILHDGGVICMFCAGGGPRPLLFEIGLMFAQTEGLQLENILVWDRCDIGLGWRYRPIWESILVAYRGERRLKWNGTKNQSNILRYPRIIPKAGEHPTPKPRDLIARLILDNSDEGDIILDPFCGGGTVPLVCYQEGRRCIAGELDKKWSEYAARRVEIEEKQLKMFCGEGAVLPLSPQEKQLKMFQGDI